MGPILLLKYIQEYIISKTINVSPENFSFSLNEIKIYSLSLTCLKQILNNLIDSASQNLIVTLNLDFLRIAEKSDSFKNICLNAVLVVPDGAGVVKLLQIKYRKKIARITGCDLLRMLLEKSNQQFLKYAFVGSSHETLSKIESKLKIQYPRTDAVFICPPYFFERLEGESSKVISRLMNYKPHILICAFGCPRQEFWLNENMMQIGAKINIGVGAALDYYAGTKRRAPALLQNAGLEWMWRLGTEPRRLFKRYALDAFFFIQQTAKIIYERKKFLSR